MWARLPAARVNAAAALRSDVGVELVGRPDPDGHQRRSVGAGHDERLAHRPREAVIRQCGTAEPELAGHGALRRDGEADDVGGAGGGAGNADFDSWFTHGGQVWRLASRIAPPGSFGVGAHLACMRCSPS